LHRGSVRTAFALLLLAASPFCLAQKWVDEHGKVYYGTPPAGVYVKPVPMTGGASSTVGAQERPAQRIPDPYFHTEPQRLPDFGSDRQRDIQQPAQQEHDREAAHEAARMRDEGRREREAAHREQESYRRELSEERRERERQSAPGRDRGK